MLSIVKLVDVVLELYTWPLIISVIMTSLVQFNVINTHNRFVYIIGNTLNQLVDPPLRTIRRYLPTFGNIDLSPIVLLLAIFLAQRYLGLFSVWLAGR